MNNEFPSHWASFEMLDVIDYEGGSQPPKKNFIYEPKSGYVRLIQIRDYGDKPFPTYVPESGKLKYTDKDDIMIARYGGSAGEDSLGRICGGIKGAYNVALTKVIFPKKILPHSFIKYLLDGPWLKERLNSLSRSCQSGFNRDDLKNLVLPLPPLGELKRIVEKLDTILPKIKSSKLRLKKIPAILRKFRQSVLSMACSGRLTEDWREENAANILGEEILKRIRKHRLEQYDRTCVLCEKNGVRKPKRPILVIDSDLSGIDELPTTWIECHIGDIGEVSNGSTPSRSVKKYWGGDIAWVNSGLVQNNRINCVEEYITKEGFKNSSVKLLPKRTVLIAMIGEGKTRGQSAILDIDATINQNIAGIVINHGLIVPEYLQLWFVFNYIKNREVGSGTGPQALNCDRVRELPFVLPPTEEQQEIVRRVEKLFKLASSLEIKYKKAMERVEKIEQAILAKAFSGELVDADPDDEPAEELLKRILAEKEKLESKKNRKF